MELHTIGIDLAKTVFHLVGLDLRGEVVVRKKFSRTQLLRFTANVHVGLIGMEACGGSHFLGRALRDQRHEVRLIPAQYVANPQGLSPIDRQLPSGCSLCTLATIAERISHSHPVLTVAGAARIEHHCGTCGRMTERLDRRNPRRIFPRHRKTEQLILSKVK